MKREDQVRFLKQSFSILETLAKDISEKISDANEGISEGNANLIIGSLSGLGEAAEHLKNIYEAMVFIHRG